MLQVARITLLVVGIVPVALTSCYDRRPTTFTATLTGVEVEPAEPTTKTPVAIKFRVGYKLNTGHTNQIMREVIVEAGRPGGPTVAKEFRLPLGGQPEAGKIDLGGLPAGEHAVAVSVRPKQYPESWTDSPSQTVTIKVREAGGPPWRVNRRAAGRVIGSGSLQRRGGCPCWTTWSRVPSRVWSRV